MKSVFDLYASLNLDDSDYQGKLGNAEKSTGSLSVASVALGNVLADAFRGAVNAVSNFTKEVINAGKEQETALAQVNTIMDQSVMNTDQMSGAIRDLSSQMGISVNELSDTVYNAISATGDTANAVELAGKASKLATAGFTDTSSALSVLTTAMNAYGLSAEEAESISDSLIMVQNLGVTTVSELSASMGKAIASASAYGVDLNNLESAYVSITKAGINTAEGTTYISSMLKELGDSSKDVSKILTEKTGKSFDQLMAEGSSLGDVLGILYEAVDGDSTALMNLWGSAEAGKASNAIISQGLDQFNENLIAISQSAGATEKAYDVMADTFEHRTEVLKTNIENMQATLFESFEPALENLVDFATASMLPALESIMTGLGSIFSGDESGFGKISEGINALTSSLMEKIPEIAKTAGSIIKALVDSLIENIPMLMQSALQIVLSLARYLIDNLQTILMVAMDVIVALANGLVEALPELIPAIIDVLIGMTIYLLENIDILVECAMKLVLAIAEGLIRAIPQLIKAIPKIISALVNGLSKAWDSMKEIGGNLIMGLWDGISDKIGWITDKIKGFGESVISSIKGIFGIHSPSRVFRDEIGSMLALGLGEGWEDEIGDVKKQIENDMNFDAPSITTSALGQALSGINASVRSDKQIVIENHVALEGDLDGLFTAIREEDHRFARSTGRSAFAY